MTYARAADYRQIRQRQVELGDESITLMTRPGFADWQQITPAMSLMADWVELDQHDRVLVGPCGHGALGVWAARQTDETHITCLDTNCVATTMAQATAQANDVAGIDVQTDVPRIAHGSYDVFCMLLPKGRDLGRLWLLNAALAVRPGGRIYIAGPNRGGIKSFLRDADALLGSGALLSYKGGNRIAAYTRPDMLPAPLPEIYQTDGMRNGTYGTFQVHVAGQELTICVRPGVFSRHGLDDGTRMLLEHLDLIPGDRVLDLGCGYGIIGLYAASQIPDQHVTLVDVDSLACECAHETLTRNGISKASIINGDGLADVPGRDYTLIASNPPFHSGHEISLEMTGAFIDESYDALQADGRLVLVANRFLTYQELLQKCFRQVEIVARSPRYQILTATKCESQRIG